MITRKKLTKHKIKSRDCFYKMKIILIFFSINCQRCCDSRSKMCIYFHSIIKINKRMFFDVSEYIYMVLLME